MSAPHPTVSLGLPIYNGQRYLRETLDSILGQTFTDFELILSDNASTDHTEAICREYAARDSRISYSRLESNIGAGPNFNRVYLAARGQYFKWCAHDDPLPPTFLEKCVELFERSEGRAVLVLPKRQLIDGDGRAIDADPCWDPALTRPRESYHRVAFAPIVRAGGEIPPFSFGLIRMDTLRAIRPMGSYYGADGVLVAELHLRGEFWEVPEKLYISRVGFDTPERLGRSTVGGWARWYGSGYTVLPTAQLYLHYVGAILRAPVSLPRKIACLGASLLFITSRVHRLIASGARAPRRIMDELHPIAPTRG